MRGNSLATAAVLAGLVRIAAVGAANSPAGSKPNVVVLFADDMVRERAWSGSKPSPVGQLPPCRVQLKKKKKKKGRRGGKKK